MSKDQPWLSGRHSRTQTYLYFKRGIDLFGSLSLLIVLSPFMLLICALIKLEDGGPVLFTQLRPGEKRKLFKIYKFRSLKSYSDVSPGQTSQQTRVGAFLRNWKLDETPQLFNVYLGQMSLVGPRPCTEQDHHRYDNSKTSIRYLAKPGMTGLWQAYRSNQIPLTHKFRFDAWYVRRASFALDCTISLKTLAVLLEGEKKTSLKMHHRKFCNNPDGPPQSCA